MQKFRSFLPLLLVLVGGFIFRVLFLTHGFGYHPDERHIMMVAERLRLHDLNPQSFAYGSFPFYLLWIFRSIAEVFWKWLGSYDGLFVLGRTLSVISGTAGVVLTYMLAQRVYNNRFISLLAAILLSFNFFHIQLSRFFTVDIILTTLALGAFLAFLRLKPGCSNIWPVAAGVLLGLSVGTKVSALSLLLPLYFVLFLTNLEGRRYRWREIISDLAVVSLLTLSAFFLADPLSFVRDGRFTPSEIGRIGFAAFGITVIFGALWPKRLGGSGRLQVLSQIATIALCTFLIVEPYAFIDYRKYLHDTREQLTLIKGGWFAPYTWQYVGTLPWLYHIKQMLLYTMGWPAGLASLAGVLFAVCVQRRKFNSSEAMILAWVIPYFLVVAAYQVKFPRYMLPLYPLFFIFAARILVILYGEIMAVLSKMRAGKYLAIIPVLVVCLCAFFRGASILSITSQPHTYHTVSQWIFEHAAPGSRIIGPHWDDRIPVSLPGYDGRQYDSEGQDTELALYEQDNSLKLEQIASQASGAQWITFATQRMQGSIPGLATTPLPEPLSPQPYTTTFLQMLYTGEIGYKLVNTTKNQPHFGPITFNDDLADESISVYDHPKAYVFENVEKLPASTIEDRIRRNVLRPDLPSMDEMLSAALERSPASDPPSPFSAIAVWYAIILILGVIGVFFLAPILPGQPALAAALSKPAGIMLFGLLAWYLSFLTPFTLTQESLISLLLVLTAILFAACVMTGPDRLKELTKALFKECFTVEIVFLAGFIVVLMIRAWQPEIFWGEKPMDSAFFNYFTRLLKMPPDDPWAAGRPLHYYYFGSYLFGLLQKLSGTPPGMGFNISLAVIAALHLAGFYGTLKTITNTSKWSIPGAFLIVFMSNLDVVKLAVVDKMEWGFDLYWASSRTLHSPGINEYPFWAYLFGDLHAHLIALPFTLLMLGLLVSLFFRSNDLFSARLFLSKALAGIVLGMLIATNSWDFITYSSIAGLIFLFRWILAFREGWNARKWRWAALLVPADLVLMGICACVGGGPLLLQASESISPHYGFVTGEEFNTGWQIFRVFGQFAPFIVAGVLLFSLNSLKEGITARKAVFAGILALLPLLLASWNVLTPRVDVGFFEIHWSIFIFFALVLLFTGFSAAAENISRETRLTLFFVFTASMILCTVELHFLMDRANTLFKFYHALWTLFGISSVVFCRALYLNFMESDAPWIERGTAIIGLATGAALVAVACVGSLINLAGLLPFQRTPGPRPTIDGTAYLTQLDGDEAEMIQWFNENVKGTPSIVEAVGFSYGPFTRVAMHTGIPVVMGWDYHVSQRGTSRQAIQARMADIKTIYRTSNPELAGDLLKKYRADFVVVGNVERRMDVRYTDVDVSRRISEPPSAAALEKFEQSPSFFTKVFESGTVRVYSVNK